jgi:hypothetical protein
VSPPALRPLLLRYSHYKKQRQELDWLKDIVSQIAVTATCRHCVYRYQTYCALADRRERRQGVGVALACWGFAHALSARGAAAFARLEFVDHALSIALQWSKSSACLALFSASFSASIQSNPLACGRRKAAKTPLPLSSTTISSSPWEARMPRASWRLFQEQQG